MKIQWKGGGEATLDAATEDRIDVTSTRAFPPGARIEGDLVEHAGLVVRIKVHGSTKTPEGAFRVHGRPLDLTRSLRDLLCGTA